MKVLTGSLLRDTLSILLRRAADGQLADIGGYRFRVPADQVDYFITELDRAGLDIVRRA